MLKKPQILKFQLFREGHKNLELFSTCFDIYLANQLICQNNWKITSNFCGLLRKAELYLPILLLVLLKTGTNKIVYWICRFSFPLGFIMSKKSKRGCVMKDKITDLLGFWHNRTQVERESTESISVILLDPVFNKYHVNICLCALHGWCVCRILCL